MPCLPLHLDRCGTSLHAAAGVQPLVVSHLQRCDSTFAASASLADTSMPPSSRHTAGGWLSLATRRPQHSSSSAASQTVSAKVAADRRRVVYASKPGCCSCSCPAFRMAPKVARKATEENVQLGPATRCVLH